MSDQTLPGHHLEVATSARSDLRAWHAESWVRPLAVFAATFALWIGVVGVGLWVEHWLVRAALGVPLALLSGRLFTLAHDAGHGSYSTSRAVNAVVGRLAFVPSVHVFGLWRHHHDLHHRYTNLRGRDFVWTPLSVDEYRALPSRRQTLHRAFRHPSSLGLGLHYATEIWAPRMVWPRKHHGLPNRRGLIADTLLLYGLLVSAGVAVWAFMRHVDPDRVGDVASWISAAVFLFVLPLIGTHWLIGFVIYLNHTHPDVVWYDDAGEWAQHEVQLEGSTGLRFRPVRHALMPRRIMNHTAHHVDPGVPLERLAEAQGHLVDIYGDRIVTPEFSWGWLRDVLDDCQLYDYDGRRWLTFDAAQVSP
ncbi:MAG: fatty acid desaturase [Ilumatobacter sp.]|uniref:fatty acid desaturase n=1 Tax=Ilumatobacter sp. TaxID=1967498 RepID=UPI00260D4D6C|nr:fatty acid desaturase [Ilumatobacter sp.]MDJ0771191.1 fatty acid desaturase [Ilumatobacter sp.]